MKLSKCIGRMIKAVSIIGAASFMLATAPAMTARADGEKPEADPSKGVTYEINEITGEASSYNCNGNSVIITTVNVDGTDYYNIYIDKDSDGEIDEDESPVELPDATTPDSSEKSPNLNTGITIYGAAGLKVTNPFTITVRDSESGINSGIFGTVSSDVSGDITLNVNNVSTNYDIAALYGGSTITGNITVNATDSTLSSLYGVNGGCNVTGIISVNAETTTIRNLYGIYGGSTCNGDVTVTVDEYSGSASGYIYGSNSSCVKGDVDVDVKGYVGDDYYCNYIYGIYGTASSTAVDGSVNVSVEGGKAYQVYGAYYGSSTVSTVNVTENVTVNVETAVVSSNVYGVSGMTVDGDVEIYATDSEISSQVAGGYYAAIKGDLDMIFENSKIGYFYGLYSGSVGGDLLIDFDEECEITSSSTMYGLSSGSITGSLTLNINNNSTASYSPTLNCIYSGSVGGDFNVDINGGVYSSIYGIYSAGVSGNANVTIKDVKVSNQICGVGYSSSSMGNVSGNINVEISGVTPASDTYNYLEIYGTYGISSQGKNYVVNIHDCTAYIIVGNKYGAFSAEAAEVTIKDNIYKNYIYGTDVSYNAHYNNDINLTIENNKVLDKANSSYIYGIYGNSSSEICSGNAHLTITDNEFAYIYGTNSGGIAGGNIDLNMENNKAYMYGSNHSSYSTSYLICYSTRAAGKITVNAKNNDLNDVYFAQGYAKEGVEINVTGGTYSGTNFYPYYYSGYYGDSEELNGDVNVSITGAKIVNYTNSSGEVQPMNFYSYSGENQNVAITIDETTEFPEKYNISQGASDNSGVSMKIGSDTLYVSGNAPTDEGSLEGIDNLHFCGARKELTEDISVNNFYVKNSVLVIPEGKTLEAKNNWTTDGGRYESSTFIVEGTLAGDFVEFTENEYAESGFYKASILYFWMNGGTTAIPDKANVYYPIILDDELNGGEVSFQEGYNYNELRPKVKFAKSGDTVKIRTIPEEGYLVSKSTYQFEGDAAPNDLIATTYATYTDYSFTMEAKKAVVEIEFTGGKISIGKTVSDPVALVGKTYTEEEPLYDFSSLKISNDSKKGSIMAALSEGQALPDGLSLEGTKIIGKVTKQDKDGKNVGFEITAKNGAKGEIILNIKSENSEGTVTPSPVGRVAIDDEDKVINAFGNSLVIEAEDDITGIYIDDDMDGKKDSSEAALTGDFSAYTLIGLLGDATDKPISITMKGGTFAGLRGLEKSNQTLEDSTVDGINLNLLGGNAGNVYLVYNSKSNAQLFSNAANGTYRYFYTSFPTSDDYNIKGYLTVFNGAATEKGNYTLNRDMTFNSIQTNYLVSRTNCWMTIPEGKTLTVEGTVYTGTYSGIYVGGTLVGNSEAANPHTYYSGTGLANGKLLIPEGGKLETKSDWNGVFYPYSYSTDLKNTNVTLSSGIYVSYNSVTYLRSGITFANGASATYPDGYTASVKVNDAEATELSSGTIPFTTAYGPTHLSVSYTPKQIELSNPFEKVVVVKDKNYTTSIPVFNYADIAITNDTTSYYAQQDKVTYEIKKGSLPEGLSLVNGRVIGKTSAVTSETIVVTVTGLNGTSVDIPVEFVVKDTESDINNRITYNSSTRVLDLKGTSVVILPDRSSSGRVNVYLDDNHDGIADDTNPFLISGSMQLDLSYSSVYGYSDQTKAYEGDISIYMYGGTVRELYGAYSNSERNPVTVNGKVDVHVAGGNVSSKAAGGYNVTADTVTFDLSGGSVNYYLYGVYNPVDVETLNFTIRDKGYYYGANSSYYMACASEGGNITGDVNVTVGSTVNYSDRYSPCYSLRNYAKFHGVKETKVAGNVNYTGVGDFVAYSQMYFVSENAKVDGNLNVDWQKGSLGSSNSNGFNNAMVQDSTVTDVVANIAEGAGGGYTFYPMVNGAVVRNIIWNGKDSSLSSAFNYTNDGTSKLTGYGYMYARNVVYVCGDCVLEDSVNPYYLYIKQKPNDTTAVTDVKVAEGVSLSPAYMYVENGKLTFKEGSGLEITNNSFSTSANTEVITEAGSTLNLYNMSINGSAVNEGTMTVSNSCTLNEGSSFVNKGEFNADRYVYDYGTITNEETGTINAKELRANYAATGDFINKGEWNQNGIFYLNTKFTNIGTFNIDNSVNDNSNTLNITTNASVINEESGTFVINSNIYNYGKVYNYGTFRQTYLGSNYYNLGTVYMAAKPYLLPLDTYGTTAENYYKNNASLYFPVVVDYPDSAFADATITNGLSSGIEGDNNIYVRANTDVTVSIGEPKEGFDYDNIDSVCIGETVFTATDAGVFKGKMPLAKAIVTVNMKEIGEKIVLNPSTIEVPAGQVGKSMQSIDLRKAVTIENDIDSSAATVKYVESTKNPLPDGISVNANGIISGTFNKASEERDAVITITGKNLSRAELTVHFGKVEKGIPSFSKPAPYGYTGYKLSEVYYSTYSTGRYEWGEDINEIIDEKAIAGEEFSLYFYPQDTANYDWSKRYEGTWNEEENRLEMMVTVRLNKIVIPIDKYADIIPTELSAVYTDKLSDIELPSNENGHFEWRYPDAEVGNVGINTFQAYFVASDQNRYYNSNYYNNYYNYTNIKVNVSKLEKKAPIFTELNAFVGDTIGSITLPEIEDGTYKWKSTESSVVEDGKEYTMVFKPNDNSNIQWDTEGKAYYSEPDAGYLFYVKTNVTERPVKVESFPLEYVNASYGSTVKNTKLPYVRAQKWYLDGAEIAEPLVSAKGVPDGNFEWVNGSTETISDLEDRAAKAKFVPVSSEHIDEFTSDEMNVTVKVIHEHKYNEIRYDAEGHYQVCSICNEVTEKEAHKYPTYEYYHNADGHGKQCSICGYVTELSEHEWNSGTVIEAPTDEKDGIMRYTCRVCGETKDEVISLKPIPEYTVPTGLKATYGDTLGSVKLPDAGNGKFSWEKSSGTSVGNVGTNKFSVTFTPNDSSYRIVNGIQVEIEVSKKIMDSIPEISSELTGLEGEKLSDVEIPVVDGGKYTFKYPETLLNEGTWNYTVVFTPNDTVNLQWPDNLEKTIIVKVVKSLHTHILEKVDRKDATCEEDGNIMYYECTYPDCGKCFKDAQGTLEIKDMSIVVINALGHKYGEPEYKWSEDSSTWSEGVRKVTATRTCERDASHVESETVDAVFEETKAATETEDGAGIYRAEFENEAFETQTKEVVIPKKGKDTEEPSEQPSEEPVKPGDKDKPSGGAPAGTVVTPDSGTKDNFKVLDISAVTAKDDPTDNEPDDITGPVVAYTGPADKNATSVTVPDTIVAGGVTYKVVEVTDNACKGMKKLKKVVIGNNVRRIGKNAFANCKFLASVTFKATSHVKTIKDNAFKGCVSLKKITIPASVKYIKNGVFSGCTKLATVNFAKKSKLINLGKKVFFNCSSMKSLKITSVKVKKIGSGTFKNAGKKNFKKLKVSVPKAKKKDYKKLLKKAGLNKRAKVK